MTLVWTYFKHFLIVTLILLILVIVFGITQHASVSYGGNPLSHKVGNEGPFIFFEDDGLTSLRILGGREEGFSIEALRYSVNQKIPATVYFQADQSQFSFDIDPEITRSSTLYDDGHPIIALSDFEGNYAAFRDFLLAHNVINHELSWVFGKGHLVLNGDFVDRGDSTTQLLWMIYKLEQEAKAAGGKVHYVIGNHEIKNMQGNFTSAAKKYVAIAGILDKRQYDFFSDNALIGRWIASKHAIVKINGVIFTHGGLHPDLADTGLTLEQINQIIRDNYRQMYYPGMAEELSEQILSTQTGPAWYRGYFRDDLDIDEIDKVLATFSAKAIVVGHTLQFSVKSIFDGKVIGIDVKHPDDYNKSFPPKYSQGLLVENGDFYRLLDSGERELL